MDSANSFGSHNYVPRQYGNANQTPLFVTDRSGNLQQSSASSHNQYGHHPPGTRISGFRGVRARRRNGTGNAQLTEGV